MLLVLKDRFEAFYYTVEGGKDRFEAFYYTVVYGSRSVGANLILVTGINFEGGKGDQYSMKHLIPSPFEIPMFRFANLFG